MMDNTNETDARILVDDLLRKAGWDPSDKTQIMTQVFIDGARMKVSENVEPANITADGDVIPTGYADYVLYDQNGRALAVIESKRSAIQPYRAKQQALPYAKALGAPFVFLTNGELIYFWDYTNDDARIVNSFFSRRDLERLVQRRRDQKPLATVPIPDYYSRQGEQREVRPYQKEAMKALDQVVELGKRRFLMHLPTGTGKTDLICLYIKRLLQANRAERILFLVDRDQLAKQALEAFQDILNQYSSYWLRAGMKKQESVITICLLQTMIGHYEDFTSGYFDVVIADECHRSIYGAWQTSLTHFDAFHIGLTATPAAYIERNTFQFYQCKDGKPDFSLDLNTAIEDGYLAPYKFASGITVLMAEGADVDEEHYDPAEFERKWTNDDTNLKMMEEFDRLAFQDYKDLAPGVKTAPGKAIVFAITKNHATRLAEILNKLHPELKGKYAEVITSDVKNADEIIRKYRQEEYPQVAVSVDMLTTGFDCPEVLHLILCRRIFSPILYQQIRGRGTRTSKRIGKKQFVIYDFFSNRKHFNDNNIEMLAGLGPAHLSGGQGAEKPKTTKELLELGLIDEWLEKVAYIEVGPDGERIDKRAYISNWEESISNASKDDEIVRKVRDGELLTEIEEEQLAEKLNQPKMYFNEENLRRAYKLPTKTLMDFIRLALGSLKLKSPDEELNENFYAWLVTKNLNPEQAQYLTLLKNRGAVRGKVELDDLFKPPLSILNAAGLGAELFGESGLREIVRDLNDSVFQQRSA